MTAFYELMNTTLADRVIKPAEVSRSREHISRDGQLDLEDVRLLVELYCQAVSSCPEFDELFFEVLERVMLADGEVQPAEQFYLLKMLYSDREIKDREKEFLLQLKRKARRTTPEFEALCQEALTAEPVPWDVGGR